MDRLKYSPINTHRERTPPRNFILSDTGNKSLRNFLSKSPAQKSESFKVLTRVKKLRKAVLQNCISEASLEVKKVFKFKHLKSATIVTNSTTHFTKSKF